MAECGQHRGARRRPAATGPDRHRRQQPVRRGRGHQHRGSRGGRSLTGHAGHTLYTNSYSHAMLVNDNT